MYKDGLKGECNSGGGGLLHFKPLMLVVVPELTFREMIFLMSLQWVGALALHVTCWFLQGGSQEVSFNGLPHATLGRG